MPNETKLEEAIQEWIAQGGRTEEQIYGVRNFLTGKGASLLSEARTDERRKVLEELKHEQAKFLDGWGHPKDCPICLQEDKGNTK